MVLIDENSCKKELLDIMKTFLSKVNIDLPNKVIYITGHGDDQSGTLLIGEEKYSNNLNMKDINDIIKKRKLKLKK